MNDDDTDSGGDFFFDLLQVLIAIFVFVLSIIVLGGFVAGIAVLMLLIWGLIA